MREIKFKAWDKQRGKFITPGYMFDINGDGRISLALDGNSVGGDGVNGERVELLQYTGLKDKNGREIYEGDIMRDTHGNHREEHQVYWAKSMGAWACDIGEEWGDMSGSYTWEVIGNIYENPGLLGENGSLGKT